MANLTGFNANQVEPTAAFEPIPAGKYLAIASASEMKPTKSGAGEYLEVTFQVLDGPFKGRNVWARFNLKNSNPTTVQIARGELSAFCRATGKMTPADSAELHNIPVVITVRQKKRQDTGDLTNEIKGFERKEAIGGQPQQAATPATGGNYAGSTPPWKRPA